MQPALGLWLLVSLAVVGLFEKSFAAKLHRRHRAQDPSDAVTTATTSTSRHGYQRFHANDSFVGQPIPCRDDEKVCFGYNLVLDTDSDTCQAVGEGYVGGCILRVDKKEFLETSGRVFGVCREVRDPCPGFRMAYDGRCYEAEVVRNVLCGCAPEPTRHFLGDHECRCHMPAPIKVEQPKEAGRCRIPDFRFPDTERATFKHSPLRTAKLTNLNCSAEQKECFGQEKVWVASAQGCHPLLKRGPCGEEEVVVLTKEQWTSGAAVCRNIRGGCAPGRVRMAFDGGCHSEREMRIAAPGRLELNVMGEYEVLGYNQDIKFVPLATEGGCSFRQWGVSGAPPHRNYPLPTCTGNEPVCSLFDVETKAPNPE